MRKNLKEFLRLKDKWKKEWKREIVDILLFSSLARGKSKPGDVDICLIFREKVNLKIVKTVEGILGERYHISSLTANDFFIRTHSLVKTLLLEGESLISGKKFAEGFGLEAKLLYSYDLSQEKASKKVKFVYLLRGRESPGGLVKKWRGEFISKSAFIVPVGKDSEVQEVMEEWKIRHKRRRIMLMS